MSATPALRTGLCPPSGRLLLHHGLPPRRPEKTVVYQVVQGHLETWLARPAQPTPINPPNHRPARPAKQYPSCEPAPDLLSLTKLACKPFHKGGAGRSVRTGQLRLPDPRLRRRPPGTKRCPFDANAPSRGYSALSLGYRAPSLFPRVGFQ